MRDDTVTTSWKRLTDKVKSLQGASADVPPAPTAMPHADSMSLGEGAPSSSSPAHATAAAPGCRTDRDREAIRQAARLATWEGEGGTSSS
jgi:hypothetical protein